MATFARYSRGPVLKWGLLLETHAFQTSQGFFFLSFCFLRPLPLGGFWTAGSLTYPLSFPQPIPHKPFFLPFKCLKSGGEKKKNMNVAQSEGLRRDIAFASEAAAGRGGDKHNTTAS